MMYSRSQPSVSVKKASAADTYANSVAYTAGAMMKKTAGLPVKLLSSG